MDNTIIRLVNDNNRAEADKWSPSIGEETIKLQEYFRNKGIDEISIKNLTSEAIKILNKCGNPVSNSLNETGLAFGYVQSGKTMSFTNLATLAKDNNYQIVIVIAGVTTNLVAQSTDRLVKDLQLNNRSDRQWLAVPNPKTNGDKNNIRSALKAWKDESFPKNKRKTVLITVMKQKDHLPKMVDLLSRLDLNNVPTLIIDDEGDQASMNTFERMNARNSRNANIYNEEQISTIYRHINALKSVLPHHAFIQYTATPQAPLFIHLMNNLSPNFIELLTPGDNYTGGKTFFNCNSNLIRIIPPDEIGTRDEPLLAPPESLIEAMRIFFLGVAEGFSEYKFNNRSMLIHPSHLTDTHEDYHRWAKNIKETWVELLNLNDTDLDKQDLLSEFERTYKDLESTIPNLKKFSELIEDNNLLHCIRETQIRQVNSRNKNQVNWRDVYSHILVGGFKMDRGFTVEGLTVTYMPRSRGVGNADTIQQRARFFGYKKNYIGFCRVYVDRFVKYDYEQYIDHEEDMRHRLREHAKTGESLNTWYREVFLDRGLRLTRPNVIFNNLERSRFGEGWFTIKSPQDNELAYQKNRIVLNDFIHKINLEYNSNEVINKTVPLKETIENFLSKLRFTKISDSTHYTALLYVLKNHVENNSTESSTIFHISNIENPRERSLTRKGQVNQLFQGRNRRSSGMRTLRAQEGVSVQIHVLNLKSYSTKQVIHREVPTVAIYIPETIRKDMIRWEES